MTLHGSLCGTFSPRLSGAVGHNQIARAVLLSGFLGVVVCALGGCYAGTAGVVLGILELADDDGGGDAPPVVSFRSGPEPLPCPDRIKIRFSIANEDAGRLSARVELVNVVEGEGEPTAATPLPGSDPLDDLGENEVVTFLWDAARDLGGDSAEVRLRVMPLEDGRHGDPADTDPFRAGNTGVRIQNIAPIVSEIEGEPVLVGDNVLVSFELRDKESDLAALAGLEISVNGDEFVTLPDETYRELVPRSMRENLPSSPEGLRNLLSFRLNDLNDIGVPIELQPIGQRGFVGELRVKLMARDCETGEPSEATTERFLVDNNQDPDIEVLPVPAGEWVSGVIPIRYWIFDEELDPADLRVEVNPGAGFEPANEFPSAASAGTRGITSIDPDSLGDEPVRTFLWDAVSQVRQPQSVRVAVTAFDTVGTGGGATARQTISRVPRAGPSRVGSIDVGDSPVSLASGDFNADGFVDVVTINEGSDSVTYLEGGRDGLSRVGREIPVGASPGASTAGDFDGDGILDLFVANKGSGSVTLLFFALSESREFPLGLDSPRALTSGDFDGDGDLDLAVGALDVLVSLELDGLVVRERTDFTIGDPWALISGNFNSELLNPDPYDDVVVATLSLDRLVFLPGSEDGLLAPTPEQIIGTGYSNKRDLEAGDSDQDGFLDVVAFDGQAIGYFQGGPDGLSLKARITGIEEPAALETGDFNGDGALDVVGADEESDTVSLVTGGPAGLSDDPSRRQSFPVGSKPEALTHGDFDGDGLDDLLVANFNSGDVTYLRGSPNGFQLGSVTIEAGDGTVALVGGDYNRDGIPDAVAANKISANVTAFQGVAGGLVRAGEFGLGAVRPVSQALALASGDFDGDGSQDLGVANLDANSVVLIHGEPGGPGQSQEIPVGERPRAVASGDFDGDGHLDLVVANESSDSLTMLRGGVGASPPSGRRRFRWGTFRSPFWLRASTVTVTAAWTWLWRTVSRGASPTWKVESTASALRRRTDFQEWRLPSAVSQWHSGAPTSTATGTRMSWW